MYTRSLLLVLILTVAISAVKNLSVQASQEQWILTGSAKMMEQTNPWKCIHPDRLRICRDIRSVFSINTNDPRLTGQADIVFDSTTTRTLPIVRVKGVFRLENHGGSWIGTLNGSSKANGKTLFFTEGIGSGGYEGLHIRLNMEKSNSNLREPMSVRGTIFKGRMPERRR